MDDAAARVVAFASGLRKNTAAAGRRWTQWPGGTRDLASVIACIEGIQQRAQALPASDDREAALATCIADLRAILEWTTYQSASIATARAIVFARKTRTFAERLGLLADRTPSLAILLESESSLIDNIATKNGYMIAIAERHPDLALPPPLIDPATLLPKPERPPSKLAFIQRLKESADEATRRSRGS